MDTNFFAMSARPPVAVVAAVAAANVISSRRHACLYSSINCQFFSALGRPTRSSRPRAEEDVLSG
jgi:hypothetical protein